MKWNLRFVDDFLCFLLSGFLGCRFADFTRKASISLFWKIYDRLYRIPCVNCLFFVPLAHLSILMSTRQSCHFTHASYAYGIAYFQFTVIYLFRRHAWNVYALYAYCFCICICIYNGSDAPWNTARIRTFIIHSRFDIGKGAAAAAAAVFALFARKNCICLFYQCFWNLFSVIRLERVTMWKNACFQSKNRLLSWFRKMKTNFFLNCVQFVLVAKKQTLSVNGIFFRHHMHNTYREGKSRSQHIHKTLISYESYVFPIFLSILNIVQKFTNS